MAAAAIGAAIGGGLHLIGDIIDDGKVNDPWQAYAGDILLGALPVAGGSVTTRVTTGVWPTVVKYLGLHPPHHKFFGRWRWWHFQWQFYRPGTRKSGWALRIPIPWLK